MQALGIISLALALSSTTAARTSPWNVGHCVISRTSSDGAVWTVRRRGQGAQLTVTKPRWALPEGETIDLSLYFLERYFGHYRPATAHKVRGKAGLTFVLGDELLLAFKGMDAVRITSGGKNDLAGWLDLEGSSKAYSRLARCRSR